jgi:type IV pilus assembly protein PilC
MQTFTYTARDTASNKVVKSTVQAESERAAAKLLIGQGMTPLSVQEESKNANLLSQFTNRITTRDRVIFTRQLATLINAGLPLTQGLHTVAEQTTNKKLESVIRDIITSVEGGSTLADAFGKHPAVFNDLFIALIAAGETSGTLDKALERVAAQQEKDAELMSKVRGALVYPCIVLFVIFGVIIFMLLTVVPQIQILYRDLDAELPLVTAIMVYAADFIIRFWWLVILLVGFGVYMLNQYIHTDQGKRVIDRLKINLPMFGDMFKKLYMARFTRTGQTLLSTGVPMLEMLRIAGCSSGNSIVAGSISKAAEKVKGGKSLSSSLKDD